MNAWESSFTVTSGARFYLLTLFTSEPARLLGEGQGHEGPGAGTLPAELHTVTDWVAELGRDTCDPVLAFPLPQPLHF